MSKLEEAKALIKAYNEGEFDNSEKLRDSIKKAKADATKAYQDMQAAMESADYPEYLKAKRNYEAANEAVIFYQDGENAGTHIEEAVYTDLKEGIHGEIDELNRVTKEKVVAILYELDRIRGELTENLNDADQVLTALQRDLYKYRDVPKYTKDVPVMQCYEANLKAQDYCVSLCLTDIINKARIYEILPTVRE